MVRQNTKFLLVALLIVGGLVYLTGSGAGLFAITGSETMTRQLPTSVTAGETFTVNYVVSGASGKWGVTVDDVVSGDGCTPASEPFVILHASDIIPNNKEVTYTAPMSGKCTFNGDYQFGNLAINNFPSGDVVVCATHSTSACSGDDIYWFDSCSNKEDIKESCPLTCTNNACTCNTDADVDCSGDITNNELITYAQKWVDGDIQREDLSDAIQAWSV